MMSALSSLSNFAESVKDDWTTALSNVDRKRRAVMSPGGTTQVAEANDRAPAFSDVQKEALAFSVNSVLHHAFTDFNKHLDDRVNQTHLRIDKTDAMVAEVNNKFVGFQKETCAEVAKLQTSLVTVQQELDKVKQNQQMGTDGKPFVPPELLEELKQTKAANQQLQETVLQLQKSQEQTSARVSSIASRPPSFTPPGLRPPGVAAAVAAAASAPKLPPWKDRTTGVMGNVIGTTTVPEEVKEACIAVLLQAHIDENDFAEVTPDILDNGKAYMCKIVFKSTEALQNAKTKVEQLNLKIASNRTTWVGTERSKQELLPGKWLTRALDFLKHLEEDRDDWQTLEKKTDFHGRRVEYTDPNNGAPIVLFCVKYQCPKFTPQARTRYGAEACAQAMQWVQQAK